MREDTSGSGDKFDVGYGVFVDAGTPTQYIFFVDRDKDLRYDVGEGLETKILTRGVTITKVCSEGIFTGIEWCSTGRYFCPAKGESMGTYPACFCFSCL